ncbi:hypothetical protein [Streptomyces chilikensis]|uniref:Secreted protein n=1 Tax=Streptomyces chilikensis TaxID=1194079 RepID=A0ABV3EJA5_9ACTN
MLTNNEIKDALGKLPRRISMVAAASAVALAATAGSLVAANDEAPDQSRTEAAASTADPWNVQDVPYNADDPSTWSLPLNDYQVINNEVNSTLLQAARSKLTASCMKNLGVAAPFEVPASWTEASARNSAGPRNAMDVRYGDHDLVKVTTYGYGWPESSTPDRARTSSAQPQNADVDLALKGWRDPISGKERSGVAKTLHGKAVPPRGCSGQSMTKLTGHEGGVDTSEDPIRKLEREAWDKMHTDPRVLAVFSEWSECMEGKGYTYEDPWAANNDPKWAPDGRSVAAIATATADVQCRRKHQVTQTMHSIEVEWQKKLMQQHPATITEAEAHTKQTMDRVNSVLGR